MEKQLVEEIIEKALLDNVSEKQICINLGLNPKNLYYYKKKYNIEICSRGKNINSKKKREFLVNDNFFDLLESKAVLNYQLTNELNESHYSWPGIHDCWSVYNIK